MKKTNNVGTIFLVILAVAVTATAVIATLLTLVGPVAVYSGVLFLLPVCFVWMLVTDQKAKDKAFKRREKAWRDNCDLPHRIVIKKVIKKTN